MSTPTITLQAQQLASGMGIAPADEVTCGYEIATVKFFRDDDFNRLVRVTTVTGMEVDFEETEEVSVMCPSLIGKGATSCMHSDRHAGTIVKATRTTITVQRDKVVPKPGSAPMSNEWIYERDENGGLTTFSRRKNGRFVCKGESARGGRRLAFGRHEHYDYSF